MTQDCGPAILSAPRPAGRSNCLGALGISARARRISQTIPTSAPPQAGDHLVFLTGPKKGQPIRSDDLELGGPQAQAYPADPNGVVRDGTRLNLVSPSASASDGLSDETRERSADGVVAYSGVCTHQACPVNMWSRDLKAFICSCHGSIYDPKNGAEVYVRTGAATLAALPLKSENGLLIVAGGFTGRVGMQSN